MEEFFSTLSQISHFSGDMAATETFFNIAKFFRPGICMTSSHLSWRGAGISGKFTGEEEEARQTRREHIKAARCPSTLWSLPFHVNLIAQPFIVTQNASRVCHNFRWDSRVFDCIFPAIKRSLLMIDDKQTRESPSPSIIHRLNRIIKSNCAHGVVCVTGKLWLLSVGLLFAVSVCDVYFYVRRWFLRAALCLIDTETWRLTVK